MKLLSILSIVIGMVLLPLSVLGQGRGAPSQLPQPPLPAGHDEARPGASLENGWAIANIGPCPFLDFYEKASNILGEPVSGFDGVRQWFQYGQLVCLPNHPVGQQVAVANLGYAELRSTGKIPEPNAPLAPAVQDFIRLSLERGGIDPTIYFGEPVSPVLCVKDGSCTQFLEKTALQFAQGATSGEQVNRAPLGLWQSHPESRPAYVRAQYIARHERQIRLPFLFAGIGGIALGVLLLGQRLLGRGLGSGATI